MAVKQRPEPLTDGLRLNPKDNAARELAGATGAAAPLQEPVMTGGAAHPRLLPDKALHDARKQAGITER